MIKVKTSLEKREQYVKGRVNASRNITAEIRNIAKDLYLSVRTIYNDYKR